MLCIFVFKEVITPFSRETRVFIIKRCFETKSYKAIGESIKEKLGEEQTMPHLTIKRIVKRFEVHFCMEDTPCSGRSMVKIEEKTEQCVNELLPHLVSQYLNSLSVFLFSAVQICIAC